MKLVLLCVCTCALLAWADEVTGSFTMPSDDITGLAWGNGYLWAVDTETHILYQLNPTSGDVINSFSVAVAGGHVITGLAFYNDILYVAEDYPGSTNSAYIYKYSSTGVFQGNVDVVC